MKAESDRCRTIWARGLPDSVAVSKGVVGQGGARMSRGEPEAGAQLGDDAHVSEAAVRACPLGGRLGLVCRGIRRGAGRRWGRAGWGEELPGVVERGTAARTEEPVRSDLDEAPGQHVLQEAVLSVKLLDPSCCLTSGCYRSAHGFCYRDSPRLG